VPRWRAHLEACPVSERWAGPRGLIGLDLGQQLESRRPDTFLPGVLHGDFHLANVMFRHDSPELAAVIDWELATLGDPLLDWGWLVATWPDATGHGAGTIHVQPWDGFPAGDELIQHYARGRNVTSAISIGTSRWPITNWRSCSKPAMPARARGGRRRRSATSITPRRCGWYKTACPDSPLGADTASADQERPCL